MFVTIHISNVVLFFVNVLYRHVENNINLKLVVVVKLFNSTQIRSLCSKRRVWLCRHASLHLGSLAQSSGRTSTPAGSYSTELPGRAHRQHWSVYKRLWWFVWRLWKSKILKGFYFLFTFLRFLSGKILNFLLASERQHLFFCLIIYWKKFDDWYIIFSTARPHGWGRSSSRSKRSTDYFPESIWHDLEEVYYLFRWKFDLYWPHIFLTFKFW